MKAKQQQTIPQMGSTQLKKCVVCESRLIMNMGNHWKCAAGHYMDMDGTPMDRPPSTLHVPKLCEAPRRR